MIITKEEQCKTINNEKFDLELKFEVAVKKIRKWKKCSIIANFLGDYQAESCSENKKNISVTISTIANELIENAIKFTHIEKDKIKISIQKKDNTTCIQTVNYTSLINIQNLISTIDKINQEKDINTLITNKIIENEDKNNSEIGILSLKLNFDCSIDYKYEKNDQNNYIVYLNVYLNHENLYQ